MEPNHVYQCVTIVKDSTGFSLFINGSSEAEIPLTEQRAHELVATLDMAWSEKYQYWYIYK